MKSISF